MIFLGCRDGVFWKFMVHSERELWSKAEKNRHWGMICTCEEHVQMRRDGVKHISCPWNSRRLEEAWGHVCDDVTAVRARVGQITDADFENDNEVYRVIRPMMQKLASTEKQRFKFSGCTPWSVSKTGSVAGAKAWIEQVQARPLEEHDSLTRLLWQKLGPHVQARAAAAEDDDIHPEHLKMLSMMKCAALDESAGEGWHAGATREKKRATASAPPHLKQAVRAKDAHEAVEDFQEKYGERGAAVLRYEWRNFKRVVQPFPAKRWFPVHMADKAFFARLYREDTKAAEDWRSVVQRLPPARPVVTESAGYREAMENEFVRAQLQPGSHYNLPRVQQQVQEDGNVTPVEEPMYFEVIQVQHSHSRLHAMETVENADDVSLTAPLAVEIQVCARSAEQTGSGTGSACVDVFQDGEPFWVEPRHLADFERWSQRLMRYNDVASSSLVGCTVLSNPTRARPPFGVLDDRCPTLAVIYHNNAHGWQSVPHKVVHESLAIGNYDAAEAMQWKGYHQCLAQIAKTMTLTTRLPSREYVAYYKVLLRGIKVEAGLDNKHYVQLLNNSKRKRGEELEMIPLEDAPAIPLGGSDGIITPAPPKYEPPKPKRQPAPPGRRSKASGARGSADPTPPPIEAPDPGGGEGGHGGQPGGGTDGIIGGTAVPIADVIVAGPSSKDKARVDVQKNQWVHALEGCKIAYRDYTTPSGVGYKNWKLWCPDHPDCECIKTKGELASLMHSYGPIGPAAYLHAWRHTPPDKNKTHVNTNPKPDRVRDYATAHSEELREEVQRAKEAWEAYVAGCAV